ncbi:nucleotidyl transferase AbiEii/AbiGii toxin family protein [Candidatus Kaiserbacteria bacterium]|nr:nucleotidyl transferase AbiEii/AbiGii toxin family protein [Candidatus Kaiserbacteria bacterium]
MPTILSANQQKVLSAIARERAITAAFILSGGTALAEFYLHHRYSEDLDFFTEHEFDPQAISVFLKKLQGSLSIDSFTFEQSFNRNLFFLHIGDDVIKTEFTYFPFPAIEKGPTIGALRVDSLLDIAVNKVFTIYQKPRARDFIDLYFILREKPEWSMSDLMRKAQIKFDHHLDPLQMSAQLLKSEGAEDLPRMINALDPKEWRTFCQAEAKTLAQSIIK